MQSLELDRVPLFAHLSEAQLGAIRALLQIALFAPGERIIQEGEAGRDRIYIVVEGEASLCKQGRALTDDSLRDYEIATRGPNGIFGEMPLLDDEPVSVTVYAKTPLTVAVLDLSPRTIHAPTRKIRNIIIAELRRHASNRLRQALSEKVQTIRMEAEVEKYRNAVSNILVTALCLLSFYTLALGTIPAFENFLDVNFAASPFVIIFFAAIFFPVIARSGFPLAFFGIRFDNWRYAVGFSLAASAAFIAAGVALKWTLIQTIPSLTGLSVISFADVKVGGMEVMLSPWYWVAVSLYLCLTPLQEFVARCGIQAPLYAFLHGSEWKRRFLSIAVSNLVFSAAHAHISLQFALAAFLPGIFWGWIFARTNSLLAAALSHFLIGGAGIFLFGIEEFVARLM